MKGEPKSSIFDFSAPAIDQQGNYITSEGATIKNGFGMLELIYPDWFDENWFYRIPVRITSNESLSPAYFDFILDETGEFFFNNCDVNGLDIRIVDNSMNLPEGWWIEYFSRIARMGTIRIKTASISNGTTDWFIYFGGENDSGNRDIVYTYDSPQPFIFAGNSTFLSSENFIIVSLADSNHVIAGTSDTTLSKGETLTIPAGTISAPHINFSATKPVYVTTAGQNGESAIPVRLSGRDFIFPAPRDTHIVTIISPYRNSNVSISDSSGSLDTFSVEAGGSHISNIGNTSGSFKIQADKPIVAFHETVETNDTCVISPPSTDITGGCMGTCILTAIDDGTEGTIYYSTRTEQTFSLNSLETLTLSGSGSQGSGSAIRIISNKPVMAISYADGDGGEMVTFLPTRWLGNEFIIPVDSQYIYATAIYPATRCILTSDDGTTDEKTADTTAQPFPKKLYWGGTTNGANIPAPASLSCNKPVWVVAERTNGDAEINVWPYTFFRTQQPEINFDFWAAVETKYSKDTQWITTPNLVPVNGVLKWQNFSISGNSEFPEGTYTGFQISNDGGNKWYVYKRNVWEEVANLSESNNENEIDKGLEFLPIINTGELMVRVLMKSESGIYTPKIDEIKIDYDSVGDLDHFLFFGLPTEAISGVPFMITIGAYDSDNNSVLGFRGPVTLATNPSNIEIEYDTSNQFNSGRATFPVTLSGSGNVKLVASFNDVRSESTSILLNPPPVLKMEKIGGDNQFAKVGETLPEPIIIKISDDKGKGIKDVAVSFTVIEGNGVVSENIVETYENGLASVTWTLGMEPGANKLKVDAGNQIEGSPAIFVARADPGSSQTTDENPTNGGCGCQVVR